MEGEYIIYEYGTQDYTGEGWALALYKLEGNELQEIYHPVDNESEPSNIGEQNIEELINVMIKKNIRKVYTVFHLQEFYRIPSNWFSLQEQDTEEIELWAEYKSIEKDGYEHQRLKENGIELLFHEEK